MTKFRVLHVANRLNAGGVERWLVGVAQGLRGAQLQWDLLAHSREQGALDDDFTANGSHILYCPYPVNPLRYATQLYRTLRREKVDAIHSHVHHFSGWVMLIAWLARVPVRIAHSHSNRNSIEPSKGPRAWYLAFMKRLIARFATRYVAVSNEARLSLFADKVAKEQVEILYCGIAHLTHVQADPNVRHALGIAPDTLVVGHVGRLSEPKNHVFLLKIFAALLEKTPNAHLLLVGEGELRAAIEQQVADLGLQQQVTLLGMRSDAVTIMASAFDVIAFPSLYEGLPLTVVEAQAVGVPILVADNITKEAEFDSRLVAYSSLQQSPEHWAELLLTMTSAGLVKQPSAAFKQTDFYMPNHIHNLQNFYLSR